MATNLKNIELVTDEQIKDILQDVIDLFLIPKFESLGMETSGEWRENLSIRGSSIWGREYTEQLVYGRRPGTFAPIAPLTEWAQRKLGLDSRQARSAAFAISKKMEKEGTTWFQKGGTDLIDVLNSEEVINFISMNFQQIITQQIILSVSNELKNVFK